MKKMFKILLLLISVFVLVSMLLSGCSLDSKTQEDYSAGETASGPATGTGGERSKPGFIKNETQEEITIVDPLGNEVTLPKNLQRVVGLYASHLGLWYEAGGKAIASVSSSSSPLPEGVEDLGSMSKISPEKILALRPDLLIMDARMDSQISLRDILEENKIPYLYVLYDLYGDYIDNLDLMSRLNGTQEQAAAKIGEIEDKINAVINRVAGKNPPKVLILFATSKSVSCELSTGTTGNMVELLGGINIVGEIPIKGENRVDFSMESIAVGDPDLILIKTMGDIEDCKELLRKDIESNEAWAAMRAVKEGKVYFLNKDLFMSKPNERFPEAFETLAGYLYQGR